MDFPPRARRLAAITRPASGRPPALAHGLPPLPERSRPVWRAWFRRLHAAAAGDAVAGPHRQPLALRRPRVVFLGGHYRGSPNVEDHIVYVAELDNGSNITLTPAEFATRFAWKNDPEKATLLKLDRED